MRTGTVLASEGIFRVAIYTGIPRESNPSQNIRPKNFEYYEWTGFTNLRLDEKGCLQPGKLLSWRFHRKVYMTEYFPKQTVDPSEAGAFTTSNNCPPALYPTSTPDIPNPYYLVQKSRENTQSGQTQSFLQPNLNNPELSGPFVSSADTGIINDKIVADGAGFLGVDTGVFRPVVANQVAAAPVTDFTSSDWGASSFRRKFKQRRRSVERVDGEMS